MNSVLREILIFIVIVGSPYLYMILKGGSFLGLFFLYYGYPAYLLIRLFIWSIKALIGYFQKLKIEKKPILNKATVSVGASVVAALLLLAGYDYMLAKGPTALVLDAETGRPVEGAVALAQWYTAGGDNLAKAAEAFSDKDGKVNIDGFWGLYIFSGKPRLTVYKPSYVLWDSRRLCPSDEYRTDFDEKHRTVRLLKFQTEAARWLKEKYDVGRGGPRVMQDSCFSSCYDSTAGTKFNVNFMDIFYKYEMNFLNQERREKK